MKPEILNDRDQRGWSWLCSKFGEAEVLAAIEKIAGNRKPFVSNIAKILGVTIPPELAESNEEKLKKIRAIRQELRL